MVQLNTVAIIREGQAPLIVPYDIAMEEYTRLLDVTPVHEQDIAFFHALVVALGILPKPPMPLLPDGRTRAEFVTSKWREDYRELNQS